MIMVNNVIIMFLRHVNMLPYTLRSTVYSITKVVYHLIDMDRYESFFNPTLIVLVD